MAGDDSEQVIPKKGSRKGRRKQLPWREDSVILERLPVVERRHLAGETNVAIAAALALDEGTIRNDLDRIRELWRERTAATIEELKAEKVAELAEVKRLALDAAAFDQMCERAVLGNEPFIATDGTPRYVYRDAKNSAQFRGNKAASIGQARQAIMDQAKVLGLIVEKVAPTDGKGNDLDIAGILQKARELRAAQADNGKENEHVNM